MLPRIQTTPEGKNLKWVNACVLYYHPLDKSKKENHPEYPELNVHLTSARVGTCTGKVFNEYCHWVSNYEKSHPYYRIFDVWDHCDARIANKWVKSSKCDEFTDDSLHKLWDLGATLDTKEVLFKNTIAFLADEKPLPIDVSDPAEAAFVADWYSKCTTLMSEDVKKSNTLPAALRTIASALECIIVYEAETDTYHRVHITAPYVRVDWLYQRMILPWQEESISQPGGLRTHGGGGALSQAKAILHQRLTEILLKPWHRWAIRFSGLTVLGVALYVPVRTGAAGQNASAFWYLAGLVNGAILTPVLLVNLLERHA